jgi:hypothetical protein
MADIVGPHLDQLDSWYGGNLDAFPTSLDNAFWNTATLRDAASALSVSASVSATGEKVIAGAAALSVSASVTAAGTRVALGAATPSVSATVVAAGVRVAFGEASPSVSVSLAATASKYLSPGFLGDWSKVSAGSESWAAVTAGSEVWTATTVGSEIWVRV